ncbi:MAG: HAMP domain-containing histidine kinase, partial [Oscillospiraceae bacterium]|nr:HAMP domain-containing histidine kinase [Oscillospiraceae bacterium]
MIRKLKIKFVAAIMVIVTVLFAAGICCIAGLTAWGYERDSLQMMKSFSPHGIPAPDGNDFSGKFRKHPGEIFEWEPERGHDKKINEKFSENFAEAPPDPGMPLMWVSRRDGELIIYGSYYPQFGEAEIEGIYEEALGSGKPSGIISRYNLRYCKAESPENAPFEEAVVFGDISGERAMLHRLVKSCLLIGGAGYAAVFIIAVILAGQAVKPVERAFEEQRQFVADASHELKTPLTVIMTNCEMLLGDSENSKKYGENILEMSRRMRRLTESLLELARMDEGGKILRKEVDMSRLAESEAMAFEPLFYESGRGLRQEIKNGIRVTGDREKLRQAAAILLDNALKYSRENSEVHITLTQQGGKCILAENSEGEDISKDGCVNIFKRFYRIDKARTGGSY